MLHHNFFSGLPPLLLDNSLGNDENNDLNHELIAVSGYLHSGVFFSLEETTRRVASCTSGEDTHQDFTTHRLEMIPFLSIFLRNNT